MNCKTCDLVKKSLTHSITDMDLHWSKEDSLTLGDYIILPQFEFADPTPENCTEDKKKEKKTPDDVNNSPHLVYDFLKILGLVDTRSCSIRQQQHGVHLEVLIQLCILPYLNRWMF
ncbi:hypothetical protein CEXT_640121 [Caerostris extrusa]|uniref:Uncharacterized protein n=1 Tax=Caerostris extrusa TaxID=172846 RepID=A0AAV4NE43_CAEEX|nr:hypothetical protein CEXT_640121 [Caerostris extrusa]